MQRPAEVVSAFVFGIELLDPDQRLDGAIRTSRNCTKTRVRDRIRPNPNRFERVFQRCGSAKRELSFARVETRFIVCGFEVRLWGHVQRIAFRSAAVDPFRDDLHFFFNDPATTENYTLSLHDALPMQ